jgi:adenosylmethionine-8-amino-7-oxononanoate aminotransferase
MPGSRRASPPTSRPSPRGWAAATSRLLERFGNHAHVGDIRGRGLFRAIELVQDRATKAPFDPSRQLNARIKREAFARGLACYPGGGTADGRSGDHVLLAPPYIVSAAEIDLIVERLGEAVDAALDATLASLPG